MIKYLFILINSLAFFIYSFFSGDGGITVSSNIPKNIAPGQEVQIEVKVAKGKQSGFAKLQIDLPAGFSVKESDNKGANYSYTEGTAKWVWASLPSDDELIVKCILVVPADASGLKTIGAKYSYVENNAKMVVEMPPVEVNIGTGGDVTNNNTSSNSSPTTAPTPTESTTANTTTESTIPTYTAPNNNSEPAGNITVTRTITKGNDGEYTIGLKINKGSTKGFARYSDDLPAEVTAKAVRSEGASFSVSDGKVKFVWVQIPEKDMVEISYSVSGLKIPMVLHGEYSYLEQNQSKTYLLPAEQIDAGGTVTNNTNTTTAEPTTTIQGNITPTTVTETTNANTVTPENTNTNTAVANSNTNSSEPPVNTNTVTETLPKTDGNINYMVQIGAFTNSAVGAGRLSKKFNISERINSEMAGGFSKFMVGSHAEYKSARDHREKMRNDNGVRTAFVVAYNTGKRITVQEALMISNQKWFK